MANRRMFSKKICRSAKFLKMPGEAQRLYFHLGLDTDDDGVVEAYSVMQAVGVSEENFNILVEKGYVKILNDDLVSYMTDWREHNVIRADRKVDSIYKELLIQSIPDIKLVEPKKRRKSLKKISEKENGQTSVSQILDNGLQSDNQVSDIGQTNDRQQADFGQHKISEDKISEDNQKKENIEEDSSNEANLKEMQKNGKDYKKIKIIFENSLEDITEENINECINYLKYFQIELVEYALIRTGMIKNPTWQYTKKILNSWLAKGINTLQQVKQDEKEFKKNNNSGEADSFDDPNGFKRKGEELLNE